MTHLLVLFLLYVVPGFAAAALFSDRTRLNPCVWVLGSIILVPLAFANLGTFGLRATTSTSAALLVGLVSVALWGAATLARRRGYGLSLVAPESDPSARLPRALALAIVVLFWLGVTATRLSLNTGHIPAIGDDLQRLSQITAIAVTGVPPRHYYIPEIPLSYYYYDVVLPGLAVRLAEPGLSCAAALFDHISIQVLAVVLGIYWIAFRLNRRPWIGFLLVLFLTLGGGWDFWMIYINDSLATTHVEHWSVIKFMVVDPIPQLFYQMSVFTTLAGWVPHHWIAGFVVLLVPVIIDHMEGERSARAVLLGILFAFVAGCSAFAALGIGAGGAVWLLAAWRARWPTWDLRSCWLALGVAALLSANLVPVYSGKSPLIGIYWPTELPREAGWLAFLQTKLVDSPKFLATILAENGIAIALFFVWLGLDGRSIGRDPTRTWIAAVGATFLPFTYFLSSPIYDDFGMRGLVPSQFAWAVGATWVLTAPSSGRLRRIFTAVAVIGALAAVPSAVLGVYRDIENDTKAEPLPASVAWINANTALDAPVLFAQTMSQVRNEKTKKQYLYDRMRIIDTRLVDKLIMTDYQYLQLPMVTGLPSSLFDVQSVEAACRTGWRLTPNSRHVYVVDGASGTRGRAFKQPPVVGDDESFVYDLDCSSLLGANAGDRQGNGG